MIFSGRVNRPLKKLNRDQRPSQSQPPDPNEGSLQILWASPRTVHFETKRSLRKAERSCEDERSEDEHHFSASLTSLVEEGFLPGGPELQSGIAMGTLEQLIGGLGGDDMAARMQRFQMLRSNAAKES
jgi:hypothetical protein